VIIASPLAVLPLITHLSLPFLSSAIHSNRSAFAFPNSADKPDQFKAKAKAKANTVQHPLQAPEAWGVGRRASASA
jgi:hypothetical protein